MATRDIAFQSFQNKTEFEERKSNQRSFIFALKLNLLNNSYASFVVSQSALGQCVSVQQQNMLNVYAHTNKGVRLIKLASGASET